MAVTGRLDWGSGVGKDFLARRPVFLTKTAVTQKQKVENRSEGGKLTVSQRATNGPLTKFNVL